jgi:hypothetical protein
MPPCFGIAYGIWVGSVEGSVVTVVLLTYGPCLSMMSVGDVDGESVGGDVGLALGLLVGLGFTGFLVGFTVDGRCVLELGLLVGLLGDFDGRGLRVTEKYSVGTTLVAVPAIGIFWRGWQRVVSGESGTKSVITSQFCDCT